jgi:hypothetical protein
MRNIIDHFLPDLDRLIAIIPFGSITYSTSPKDYDIMTIWKDVPNSRWSDTRDHHERIIYNGQLIDNVMYTMDQFKSAIELNQFIPYFHLQLMREKMGDDIELYQLLKPMTFDRLMALQVDIDNARRGLANKKSEYASKLFSYADQRIQCYMNLLNGKVHIPDIDYSKGVDSSKYDIPYLITSRLKVYKSRCNRNQHAYIDMTEESNALISNLKQAFDESHKGNGFYMSQDKIDIYNEYSAKIDILISQICKKEYQPINITPRSLLNIGGITFSDFKYAKPMSDNRELIKKRQMTEKIDGFRIMIRISIDPILGSKQYKEFYYFIGTKTKAINDLMHQYIIDIITHTYQSETNLIETITSSHKEVIHKNKHITFTFEGYSPKFTWQQSILYNEYLLYYLGYVTNTSKIYFVDDKDNILITPNIVELSIDDAIEHRDIEGYVYYEKERDSLVKVKTKQYLELVRINSFKEIEDFDQKYPNSRFTIIRYANKLPSNYYSLDPKSKENLWRYCIC